MIPGSNTRNGIRPVSSSCSRKVLNSSTTLWHDSQTSTDRCCVLHAGTFLPQYRQRHSKLVSLEHSKNHCKQQAGVGIETCSWPHHLKASVQIETRTVLCQKLYIIIFVVLFGVRLSSRRWFDYKMDAVFWQKVTSGAKKRGQSSNAAVFCSAKLSNR